MKLAKGDHFEKKSKMNMIIHTSVYAQESTVKRIVDMAAGFDVIDATADQKKLKLTYTKATISMNGEINPLIDMPGPDIDKLNEPIDSLSNDLISKKLPGLSVDLILSKDNKITGTKNSTIETVIAGMNLWDINHSLDKMEIYLSAPGIKEIFGTMWNSYPAEQVAIGDSWEAESKADLAGKSGIKLKTTFTLVSIEKNIATISLKGKVYSNDAKSKISGSQKGKITIALTNGYIQQGNYTILIEGEEEEKEFGIKLPFKSEINFEVSGN